MKHFFILFSFLFSLNIVAQTKVSGTVTDETNKPLQGVSIVTKPAGKSTITDANGRYSLTVNNGTILSFSYTGNLTSEYTVNGSVLDVRMKDDVKVLDEVFPSESC